MRRSTVAVFVAGLLALLVAGPAFAAKRVALVIGNDAYDQLTALEKAAADAKGYAALARTKGFDEVIERTNLTRQEMDIAIAEFLQAIEPGDTALFVYSGHGWSDGSQNYLVGVDAPKTAQEALLARISIPLQNGVNGVLDEVARRGASLKVAIVDACRDNPFLSSTPGRSIGIGRGLSRIDPPRGTFVVFSAGAGQVALDRLSDDDPDPNGVFTRVLLPLLEADKPLLEAVKTAQREVFALAREVSHTQEPAYYDQVRGNACISQSCGTGASSPTPAGSETVFWTSIANSKDAADFQAYLQVFPNGVFVPLAKNRLAALTPADEPEPIVAPTLHECDRLASEETVEFKELRFNPGPAIVACREAVIQHPEEARFAQQLGRALQADERYSEAKVWYETAIEFGHTGAMISLGNLYSGGRGVKQDYAEARRWYEKAAALGDGGAMGNLGMLYHHGRGVEQDYAEARRLYEKAAELGDASAMANLGFFYNFGKGVEQDYAEARRWYEKASALGVVRAMNNLAMLHEIGNGVEQDYAEARRWYEKAVELGSDDAMYYLGWYYETGRGVEQDYVEARRLYEKAAELGVGSAMAKLGTFHEAGLGVEQDYAEARRWYEKGAELGSSKAMTKLAALHEAGLGGEQDYAEALHWYEKAAESWEVQAMTKLGTFHEAGLGVEQDYAEARRWYEKAAEFGNASAMTSLGALYETGQGGEQDYAEAGYWYEKAAEFGNASAMTSLGMLHVRGLGVARDTAAASELFLRAMAQGDDRTFEQFLTESDSFDRQVRRAIEQYLIDRGYLAGSADGAFGSAAKAALREYQEAVKNRRS